MWHDSPGAPFVAAASPSHGSSRIFGAVRYDLVWGHIAPAPGNNQVAVWIDQHKATKVIETAGAPAGFASLQADALGGTTCTCIERVGLLISFADASARAKRSPGCFQG